VSRRTIILICGVWLALLLATHAGGRSPYAYGWAMFDASAARFDGVVVNPDATPMYQVMRFFYDLAPLDYSTAYNLRLPFHAFLTAVVASFLRSYILANYLLHLLLLLVVTTAAVRLAERFAIPRTPLLLALLTIQSLPLYAGFIGQPLHYIAGTAINFLVVLALLALPESDLRNPWISGMLTAVLTLNYDWYVFGAAAAAYLLLVVRFPRRRDVALYLGVAAAPGILWTAFLQAISNGTLSSEIQRSFMRVIANEWLLRLREPGKHLLLPFLASHVGLHIAFSMVLAMIYWPLLAFCLAALYRFRAGLGRFRGNALVLLLAGGFVAEQLVTALFDWENNPRRAIPVVFAFAWCYCWAADRAFELRRWRAALVVLFLFSACLAYADTLFRTPAVTYLYTGQAIREAPKEGVRAIEGRRLTRESMPYLMEDRNVAWWGVDRAVMRPTQLPLFAMTQCATAAPLLFLAWTLTRAALLPRRSATVLAVVWVLSVAGRFV
jgi:hypothetical protein